MNTNENIPMTNDFRLNRIKKVSKCFRLFLQFGFPLMMLVMMLVAVIQGVWNGLHAKQEGLLPKVDGVFIAKSAILLLLFLFGLVMILVWYWTSLKFFRFLEKGMLFTAETARCLKIMGFTIFAEIIFSNMLYN